MRGWTGIKARRLKAEEWKTENEVRIKGREETGREMRRTEYGMGRYLLLSDTTQEIRSTEEKCEFRK